ncbi:hypothetical protein D3C87_1991570 [compost metagenome]
MAKSVEPINAGQKVSGLTSDTVPAKSASKVSLNAKMPTKNRMLALHTAILLTHSMN